MQPKPHEIQKTHIQNHWTVGMRLRDKSKMRYIKNAILLIVAVIPLSAVGYKSYTWISTQGIIKSLSKHELTLNTIDAQDYFSEVVVSMDEIAHYKNQRYILTGVVRNVTEHAANDLERAILWTKFLQDKIVHPKRAPLLENGMAIFSPIWILTEKLAHCGQTNRLILDGLETIGIEGRVVQLKDHVIAEILIDGKYIALDADMLDYGNFFSNGSGGIPSALEIHLKPSLLDNLHGDIYQEYETFGDNVHEQIYWVNYLRDSFSEPPYYYYKTATDQQLKNEYYGWNYYHTER